MKVKTEPSVVRRNHATGRPKPTAKQYTPIRTVDDLITHLQWAVCIELSTIPPYLYALYSIRNSASEAAAIVRSVVVEEMLHMMLASNLMNAIGRSPSITGDTAPSYPGYMRHHAAGGPFVQLMPLSVSLVEGVFLEIEKPEEFPGMPAEGDYYETLGQFYRAVEEGFEYCAAHLGEQKLFGRDTGFQRNDTYVGSGGGKLLDVHNLEAAKRAITEIVQQGEGAPALNPRVLGEEKYGAYEHYGPRPDGTYGPILGTPFELSHYRKFQQLTQGTIPIPATYPAVSNPSTAVLQDPVRDLAALFDECYGLMLRALERALGSPAAPDYFFGIAFYLMHSLLPPLARLLMQTPVLPEGDPDVGPNAGPAFIYVDQKLAGIVVRAERLAAKPWGPGAAYQQQWTSTLDQVREVLLEVRERDVKRAL